MRPTRDETMMELARVIARRSTCQRRQVGAVATDVHGRVLSIAYNGVPMGHRHCGSHFGDKPCPGAYERSGSGLDLCEAIHAEQNILLFCNDIMRLNTIYVTVSPCVHCVKMLLNTAAKRVVYLEEYSHDAAASRLWTSNGSRTWERLGPAANAIVHANIGLVSAPGGGPAGLL